MNRSNVQIYEVNNGFIVRNVVPQDYTCGISNPTGTWVFNSVAQLVKELPDILCPKPPIIPPTCVRNTECGQS